MRREAFDVGISLEPDVAEDARQRVRGATPTLDRVLGFSLLVALAAALGAGCSVYLAGTMWVAVGAILIQELCARSARRVVARYDPIRQAHGVFLIQLVQIISVAALLLGLGVSPFLRLDIAVIAIVAVLVTVTYETVCHFVWCRPLEDGQGLVPASARSMIGVATFFAAALEPATMLTPIGAITAIDALVLVAVSLGAVHAPVVTARTALKLAQLEPVAQSEGADCVARDGSASRTARGAMLGASAARSSSVRSSAQSAVPMTSSVLTP